MPRRCWSARAPSSSAGRPAPASRGWRWRCCGSRGRALLPFARLVADDRVHVEAAHGRLLVRPAAALAGLIEVRGLGIRRLPYEPVAVVGLLVDLAAATPSGCRLPGRTQAEIAGIALPRLAVAAGADPLPLVLAYLRTT